MRRYRPCFLVLKPWYSYSCIATLRRSTMSSRSRLICLRRSIACALASFLSVLRSALTCLRCALGKCFSSSLSDEDEELDDEELDSEMLIGMPSSHSGSFK